MDIFNFLAGLASFAGLIFSIWITIRTGKIQKAIEYQYQVENFNINWESIMSDLRSSGLNAIREEFPSQPSLLQNFHYQLLSYRKQCETLLDSSEKEYIDSMLHLLETSSISSVKDRKEYMLLLDHITSKPRIRRD